VLNVLPFQMADQDPGTGAAGIGFAYLGYLSGLLVSLNTERLSRLFQSEGPLYALGLGLYALGLGLFALSATVGVYLAMFAFCGGMFLIHTRLSGQVNQWAGPIAGWSMVSISPPTTWAGVWAPGWRWRSIATGLATLSGRRRPGPGPGRVWPAGHVTAGSPAGIAMTGRRQPAGVSIMAIVDKGG
jgi:hypothetical protein